jgi:hypothetical protein
MFSKMFVLFLYIKIDILHEVVSALDIPLDLSCTQEAFRNSALGGVVVVSAVVEPVELGRGLSSRIRNEEKAARSNVRRVSFFFDN